MCHPPSEHSINAVLGTALPDVVVERVQAVPSPRLQRLYEVTLSDGRTLHLVLAPSPRLRLLRSEHFMIPSEAVTVRWIHSCLSNSPDDQNSVDNETPTPRSKFLALVPKLVHLSHGIDELGAPCAFFEPTIGSPLSLVPNLLSSQERRQVDRRVGRLFRELAHLTSPSGRFGSAPACLSTSTRQLIGGGGIGSGGGSSSSSNLALMMSAAGSEGTETWSGAFHLMLEGILRDGEDMAVMISYSAIRRHFRRLRHLLDLVAEPRLFVLDGADETNVLVASLPTRTAPSAESTVDPNTYGKGDNDDDEREDGGSMAFAGLRDWSNCIFGDPLLATVFSDGMPPSPGFLEGFDDDSTSTIDTNNATTTEEPPSPTAPAPYYPLDSRVIDDVETAPVRRLLYQVYHSTVSIIREFYRPRGGSESSRRELEARKKLTEALARLELVQDHPKRSFDGARLSGEMSPAKRAKQGGGDGDD